MLMSSGSPVIVMGNRNLSCTYSCSCISCAAGHREPRGSALPFCSHGSWRTGAGGCPHVTRRRGVGQGEVEGGRKAEGLCPSSPSPPLPLSPSPPLPLSPTPSSPLLLPESRRKHWTLRLPHRQPLKSLPSSVDFQFGLLRVGGGLQEGVVEGGE